VEGAVLVINNIAVVSTHTIPVNNAQNERGKNGRESP
jgi:hypothetical protein